jgi:nicotinate-nucleotide adenylyltransferase
MESKTKVVAVYGGSFDPVHQDHLRVAWECLNFDYCDEVWFMPSPKRWDKQPIASEEDRLAMLRLATADEDRFRVSHFELNQGEFRGSYRLLCDLRETFPDFRFRLLVGADTYPTIPEWRDPQNFSGENFNGKELLKNFGIIVLPRAGSPMPDVQEHTAKGYRGLYTFEKEGMETFLGNISSSEVRRRVSTKNFTGALPMPVEEYIQHKDLYR